MSETKNISLKGLRTFLRPLMNLINRKAETWDDLKKKPFGSEWEEVKLVDNVSITSDNQYISLNTFFPIVIGQEYTVIYDDVTYECVGYDGQGALVIGDLSIVFGSSDGFPESIEAPFLIVSMGTETVLYFKTIDSTNHTLTIITKEEIITKLDGKYLDFDTSNLVKSVNGNTPDDYGDVYLTFSNISGNLPISKGGTGAATVANARGNLGLGYTSGALPIANGGTGATSAASALTNLGITATAAELNKMDGVTATTTELNYVDGVTSNIQTQLNAKVPTTRKVNNKTLSADITLTASDVGAISAGSLNIGNGTGTGAVIGTKGGNTASGEYSTALGWCTKAMGRLSSTTGNHTIATSLAQNVIGTYNRNKVTPFSLSENNVNLDTGSNVAIYMITPGNPAPTFSDDLGLRVLASTCATTLITSSSALQPGTYIFMQDDLLFRKDEYNYISQYFSIVSGSGTHYSCKNIKSKDNTVERLGYLHIAGNGRGDGDNRSNAHTLDWDGNGWYQSSVCVGGTDGSSPAASLGANGLVLTDETTGTKYRIFINNGEISTELLS